MGLTHYLLKIHVFESYFQYKDNFIPSIAVKHTNHLKDKDKDTYDTWLSLLKDLAQSNSEILDQHAKIEPGPRRRNGR
jgi:hypothetical protein